MATNVLLLKVEGNTHTKNGNYLAAIKCYDGALKRTRSEADAAILILNRCHAQLQSQQFDAAFNDAKAVIDMSLNNPPEKALFRAARALYGLKRWTEALDYFNNLLSLFPNNYAARQDVARCRCRLREATGDYDFKSMLEEAVAKAPSPDMDRANYIGSVEVRDCEIKSHGRGLFTTKAVEAGELLLCEKAFAAVFADPKQSAEATDEENEDSDDENRLISIERRHALEANTMVKLHRNPSLQAAFAELYPGPDWTDERDKETGKPIVNGPFVQNRIAYNAFGFPISTHEYHWAIGHHPDTVPDDIASSHGVWITASFINHSCYPMVRRSFIGDMMVFRAQQNIPANTELKFGYISGLEERSTRQRKLKNYGFDCDCQVCEAEGSTSRKKMKRRLEIVKEIVDIFEKGDVNSLQTYTDLLDKLEATYVNPPSKEYRRAMITPLSNIITGCLESGLPLQVIELTYRLLLALGFEIEVTNTSFKIIQWGFLIDEIVISLVDLCDAYKLVNPILVGDAEAAAKKCYLIMCGEDVSWDKAYGPGGLRDQKQEDVRRIEDLAEGVDGLKYV